MDEKNPHYGLKAHASVDINHGFVLATTLSPASEHYTHYFQYCTVFSRHTKQPIEKVYADKGYHGEPNRSFLVRNKIQDGIMRKNTTTVKLTPYEEERNKGISKIRYKVEIFRVEPSLRSSQQSPIPSNSQKQLRLVVPPSRVQHKKEIENLKSGVHIILWVRLKSKI